MLLSQLQEELQMEHSSREELSQQLTHDKSAISKLQDELENMQAQSKNQQKTVNCNEYICWYIINISLLKKYVDIKLSAVIPFCHALLSDDIAFYRSKIVTTRSKVTNQTLTFYNNKYRRLSLNVTTSKRNSL